MTDRLTCCPHCNTSFRITDQQLQIAQGSVRCGSCLRVFKASEHLLETKTSAEEGASNTAEPYRTSETHDNASLTLENPETRSFQLSDDEDASYEFEDDKSLSELDKELDDLLISDDTERFEDTQTISLGSLDESFQARGLHGDGRGALFDHRYKTTDTQVNSLQDTDESWAVELLSQLEEEDNSSNSAAEEHPREEEFSDLTSDISFVGQFYSDLESPSHPSNASYIRLPTTSEKIKAASEPQATDDTDILNEERETPNDDQGRQISAAGPEHKFLPDTQELLSAIPTAPVEMEWQPQHTPWVRRLTWGSLCLTAALLLVAQYAWYHIDQLGLQQPWRQVYTQLCPYLGCQPPALVAPEKIKTSNLVVRSHPKREQALIIDCVLLNTASFSQPFPDFQLAFSNIKGQLIAQRRFTPQEYLKGELAGVDSMPSNQPVHIAIEIIDPGKDAVNYTASIPQQ